MPLNASLRLNQCSCIGIYYALVKVFQVFAFKNFISSLTTMLVIYAERELWCQFVPAKAVLNPIKA